VKISEKYERGKGTTKTLPALSEGQGQTESQRIVLDQTKANNKTNTKKTEVKVNAEYFLVCLHR
jgi:hypothetical protein